MQVAEDLHSPAFVTGKVAYKTIKGSRYAYWAFKELDGGKREYYLGSEEPAIAAIEAARERGAPARDAVARQAAAALAQGCTATPPKHLRLVKRLAEYQFSAPEACLWGRMRSWHWATSSAWRGAGRRARSTWTSRTQARGGNVAVALPANLQVNAHDALTSLEHGFLPALGGSKGMASLSVSEREPELRVDFLTVSRRAREILAHELGVALSPLKFLDYLIERPGQAVLLDRADACLVNLPDPARYGLHKLIVAHERGARHPKHGKDIPQALALIDWHLQRAPHALVDAWADLAGHGIGWVKRARASLAQTPVEQRDVVPRFEHLVGLPK